MKFNEKLKELTDALEKADVFFGHGVDNAHDEAIRMIVYITERYDNPLWDEEVSDHHRWELEELLKRRINEGKPLAYLTNQAWFLGMPFYVDERVLIPRSPFAEWIESSFEPWVKPQSIKRILEIGTGSGCMAIAAAMVFQKAKVDAVDIDSDALEVAAMNVKQYELEDRVNLIQSDCFENVSRKYDLIIANPPYVSDEEMAELPQEYSIEPRHALRADDEGLAIVLRILAEATTHLTKEGVIVVEVGHSDETLQKRFPNIPFVWLEQQHGGQGLFIFTRKELLKYEDQFKKGEV